MAASASPWSFAIFCGSFWLTWQLADFGELGDYLLRVGLSWLFLTFLSFLAFSGLVTALSTFFLSADLRLLVAAPIDARRLFYARFFRTLGPGLVDGGRVSRARAAWRRHRALRTVFLLRLAVLTIVPFTVIPVSIGTAVTFALVNVFPARRARDFLMVTGLLFAASSWF